MPELSATTPQPVPSATVAAVVRPVVKADNNATTVNNITVTNITDNPKSDFASFLDTKSSGTEIKIKSGTAVNSGPSIKSPNADTPIHTEISTVVAPATVPLSDVVSPAKTAASDNAKNTVTVGTGQTTDTEKSVPLVDSKKPTSPTSVKNNSKVTLKDTANTKEKTTSGAKSEISNKPDFNQPLAIITQPPVPLSNLPALNLQNITNIKNSEKSTTASGNTIAPKADQIGTNDVTSSQIVSDITATPATPEQVTLPSLSFDSLLNTDAKLSTNSNLTIDTSHKVESHIPQSIIITTPTQSALPVHTVSVAHHAGDLAHAVGLEITKASRAGRTEFIVRLDPAELGRIEIKMHVSSDGKVQAALSCDNPQTHDMLRREVGTLERTLTDAGLKTDSGALSFNLRDQNSQSQNRGYYEHNNSSSGSKNSVFADSSETQKSSLIQNKISQFLNSNRIDVIA